MKTAISILFVFNLTYAFGQFTFNTDDLLNSSESQKFKRIAQYEDAELIQVVEFDSLGNQVFTFKSILVNRHRLIRYYLINLYKYDDAGRLITRYSLHSNVGFRKRTFRYPCDSIIDEYTFKYVPEEMPEINTNGYESIKKYSSYDSLVNSSCILSIDQQDSLLFYDSRVVFLNEVDYLDYSFDRSGDTISRSDFKYNDSDLIKTMTNYKFGSKKVLTKTNQKECKISTLYREDLTGTKDTIHKVEEFYNEAKLLTRRITYTKDVRKEYVYYYKRNKRKIEYSEYYLIEPTGDPIVDDAMKAKYVNGLIALKTIKLKNGFRIKETIKTLKPKHSMVSKYNYEIEKR